ncbi:MCP four helix bundle domain-containing protein [Dactylosporangium sp. McL0621]|uniref:MCP four helix bundle domain-containing protein n=1 Tax=Dactylosporangium sp. McL0621 TaxID=3415678 RepID=UPI003CE892F3
MAQQGVQVTVARGRLTAAVADRGVITKAFLTVLLVTLVAAAVAILSLNRMSRLNSDLHDVKTRHLESSQQLTQMRAGMADMYRSMLVYSLLSAGGSQSQAAQFRTAAATADERVDAAVAAYHSLAAGSSERLGALQKVTDNVGQYRALRDVVVFHGAPPSGFTMPAQDKILAMSTQYEISRIIARINDYQLTIASAVEEQSATTAEMSRSVGEAAHGATNIAGNISGVAQAAQATSATLAEADTTVTELSRPAADLQREVGRFKL